MGFKLMETNNNQVIQRDLFILKRWRSPTTFEGVTSSPSQKGHNRRIARWFQPI